jgi:hypothetical protein
MITLNNGRSLRSLPAVVLALAIAPAAQAGSFEIPRDTGVGLQIAAQGNLALREIRQDLLRSVQALRPMLPAQPVPVSAPALAPAGSGATSLAPGQRCAK